MTTQGSFTDRLKTRIREKIAKLMHVRYANPADGLVLIGVTGTKGKTTVTQLIYQILREANLQVGYISTIGARIGDQELDTGLHVTSPEAWELPKYLRMMKKAGIQYVVLESTSIGLQQGRLEGLEFNVGVITNINSDHLDYHVSWDNYASAKFRLIEMVKEGGLAVLNADNESSEWLRNKAQNLTKNIYAAWYSKSEVQNLQQDTTGMSFDFQGVHFTSTMFGGHMLENVLSAIKACSAFIDLPTIAKGVASYELPAGRMEIVQNAPFSVIIDFAHTPDSLERSLEALHELKGPDERIITVFGCAGDRDPSRRRMGISAAKYSKLVVLTAEDPRGEELYKINSEIFQTAENERAVLVERFSDHSEYVSASLANLYNKIERVIFNQDTPFVAFDEMSVNSRIDAIDFALGFAKPGDTVYITGKGHEKSLAFNGVELEWSDQIVTKNLLMDLRARS